TNQLRTKKQLTNGQPTHPMDGTLAGVIPRDIPHGVIMTVSLARLSLGQSSGQSCLGEYPSEQGRYEGAPFPTFTLPQVEHRFQQVQSAIRSRLAAKEMLSSEIEAMTQVLAEKKKKATEIDNELVFLDYARDELQDLYLIAHARLAWESKSIKPESKEPDYLANNRQTGCVGIFKYRELATLAISGVVGKPNPHERPKFKISLAEYLRKGVPARDYATTSTPENLVSDSVSETKIPELNLTPQQLARKQIKKLGVLKRENAWLNVGHPIPKENETDKSSTRNSTENSIAKNDDTARIVVDQCRYIEKWGPRAFTNYRQRRNGHLQRPEDYSES
ncbi:hypothetical protein EV360DRAFT_75190, partial [Lentinula raphanica]